jgi:hypothetical protein
MILSWSKEYKIMFVINHINEKNRRMFFDNIVYVSFIDVILIFVTRLKKQDFVWDMYKKTVMNKLIDAVICDIEKNMTCFFWNIDQSKNSSMLSGT